MTWEVIAEYICATLNMVEEVWITVDANRAIFVCSSILEAVSICDRKILIPRHGEVEFS